MSDLWNRCWKGVGTVIGVIAIITTLTVFYSNLATSADLEKVKDEFKKSMELDRNINRLNQVNQDITRLKMQQRDYPKDKSVVEDLQQAKEDKIMLQERIEKR